MSKSEIEKIKAFLSDLKNADIDNPSFEDSRIEWMEIQIDKSQAKEIREFLAEFTKMAEIKKEDL